MGESSFFKWPETELPNVAEQAGQPIRVFCAVWNLHGKHAPADISPWLPTQPKHHMYVIGTCECERTIEKSLIWANKARWEQQVRNHFGEDYLMVGAQNMSAIHVMVFLHRYLWRYCWDIKTGQVATGFANWIGNKGGTQVGFSLGRTSFLFSNAHLAAHTKKMKERTQSLSRIMYDSPIKSKKAGGIHEEYDRVFFMGDLNARVEAPRADVDAMLEAKNIDKCLESDQLRPLLEANEGVADKDGPAGLWPLFEEAKIRFMPTYKYDPQTDIYDSGKKQRVPSWTDRILWKKDSKIRSLSYDSVQELKCSDHRPIFAQFEVEVDLDNWAGPPTEDKRSRACAMQ